MNPLFRSPFLPLIATLALAIPTFAYQDETAPPKPIEPAPADSKPEDGKEKTTDNPNEKPTEAVPSEKSEKVFTPPAPKVEVADSPAKALLRHAAEVVKNAHAISFKVKLYGEGGMLSGAPALEAEEKLLRAPDNSNAWLIRAIGSGSVGTANRDGAAPKALDPSAFDIVWTPTTQSWIEHSEKTVYTRPPNAVRGKNTQTATSAKLRYFNLPNPFQKELLPTEFTQEDPATINGELCDVISTKGDRGSHDRYSIAQKDGFPRRIEKVFDSDRIKGRYVTDFTDVKINPDIAEEYFKLPIPDGYKEDVQLPKPATHTEETKGDLVKSIDGTTPPIDPNTASISNPATNAPAAPAFEAAPDIDLPLNSGTIKLSSLKGNVVVLDFFGTWALSSKGTHEELKKEIEHFKDKPLRVLSFAVREKNPDAATEYFSRSQLTWDLAKRGDSVGAAFRVKTYPFWIVIDQDGKIRYYGLAGKNENATKLDDAISDALGLPRNTSVTAPASEPTKEKTPPAPVVSNTGSIEPTDVKK